MRKVRFPFVLASLVWAGFSVAQDDHPEPDERGFFVQVGDPMPAFELTDLTGQTFSRTSLLGKPYVLQFTASWCGVCRAEMPHLEKDVWQGGAGTLVIGVDLDEPAEKVATFADQTGVSYPMAPDPGGQVFQLVAAPKSGVTRNVVVNTEGRIVFLTRLFDETEFKAMKAMLAELNP
jgi:peroxiredoxin